MSDLMGGKSSYTGKGDDEKEPDGNAGVTRENVPIFAKFVRAVIVLRIFRYV